MTQSELNRRQMIGGLGGAAMAMAVTPGVFPRTTGKESPMRSQSKPADYVARDFSGLIGTAGFSEALLKNHFTLYQGYVKNTNTALASLAELAKDGKLTTPSAAEMRRRLG